MGSEAAREAAALTAKYRKYERDYMRRLNALYFSGKTAENGEVFEGAATIDDFVIQESKEAPLKKYLAASALVSKDPSTPKPDPPEIDANLPSTSNKKSQRSTPDGNRKPTGRGK